MRHGAQVHVACILLTPVGCYRSLPRIAAPIQAEHHRYGTGTTVTNITSKASNIAMHEFSIDGRDPGKQVMGAEQHAARDGAQTDVSRLAWAELNSAGLAHGAAGDWPSAYDAFAAAAHQLAVANDAQASEALAVVHNNLAQASFRLGRRDEALRHAHSVCATRVTLVGDDSLAVARVRADLAVMLCRVGRFDDAQASIRIAMSGIAPVVDDEDSGWLPLLETAARISLAAGQPSSAEPYLLRWHALLSAHQLPTAPANELLARVARARTQALTPPSASTGSAPRGVLATTSADGGQDRARTTSTPSRVASVTPIASAGARAMRSTPVLPLRASSPTVPPVEKPRSVVRLALDSGSAITSGASEPDTSSLALIGFDFELAEDPRKAPAAPIASKPVSPLGFEIEYGTPQEPIIPDFATMDSGPLLAPLQPASVRRLESGRPRAVVLPTPTKGNQAVMSASGARASVKEHSSAARSENGLPTQSVQERAGEIRSKARMGRALAPRSTQGAIVAAVVLVALAVAAYIWLVVLPNT